MSIALISVLHGMAVSQTSQLIQLGISTSGQNLVVSAKPGSDYTGVLTSFAVTIRWQVADNINLGAVSSTYDIVKSDGELTAGAYESQMFALKDYKESLHWTAGTEYTLFSVPISESGAGPFTIELAPIGFKTTGEGDPYIAFNNIDVTNLSTPYYTGSTGFALPSLANTTITPSPASIVADGLSHSIITVQLKDGNGNNITTLGWTVVLATTAGTLSTPVTENPNGTYTATLTSATLAGTATVTGTVNGQAITNHAVVTFTAGAASVATSTITADPTTIAANASSTSTITVQLKDANGNNLATSGGAVVLATTAGTLGTVTDNNNGTYTAVLTAGIVGADAMISGTLNTVAFTHTATVTMTQVYVAISGTVGVGGVTLSWKEGTTDKTATSGTGGTYTLNVPFAWTGTITPSLAGYTFTPLNREYTNVRTEQTAQDYAATAFVTVALKAYLAGPFANGTMTTTLNAPGLMPLSSEGAYPTAMYNNYTASTVTSVPVNMVDWVLVELRTAETASTRVATQAAFIANTGAIVGTDGTSPLVFSGIAHGDYYAVVRHRNHLPVMSTATITLNGPSVAYDFTTASNKAYGTNAMVALTGGVFGMWPGDINRNGTVKFTGSQNDEAGLISAVGLSTLTAIVPGYLDADINMDGNATFTGDANDNSILIGTVGLDRLTRIIASQVPN